jgi:hypothetical protein
VGHGARDLAIAVVLVGSRVLKPMSAAETEVWLGVALLGVTAWWLWSWRK